MKKLFAFVLISLVSVTSFAANQFPMGPDENLTPGVLCSRPDSRRYPEQIPYCSRNVDTGTKKDIFVKYDQLGFRTRSMDRRQFKIDHYIPLCMGGANDERNLWPQHSTIYTITDPLEQLLCEKMAAGKLLQKDAVALIKEAKNHLDEVPSITSKVEAL